jgi:endoglucanase
VVRRDQGGDTVSEGQAYAMLLAAATGDSDRFATVWSWTRVHLQRRDALLSWRWADGRVADPQPATDADLDAARALALAGRRFDSASYRAAGRRLAGAILRHETVQSGGDPVLSAGPWANDSRMVNPSYFSPRAYGVFAGGDRRWRGVAASSRRLVDKLTRAGLPPDWAQLQQYGIAAADTPQAGATAQGGSGPRYSFDALRMPLRFAESCNPADRRLAARQWQRLRRSPDSSLRSLDGTPKAPDNAAALAGAAGAAWAAGNRRGAGQLLDQADAADRQHPTYYGAAWAALGRIMLQTHALGACWRR